MLQQRLAFLFRRHRFTGLFFFGSQLANIGQALCLNIRKLRRNRSKLLFQPLPLLGMLAPVFPVALFPLPPVRFLIAFVVLRLDALQQAVAVIQQVVDLGLLPADLLRPAEGAESRLNQLGITEQEPERKRRDKDAADHDKKTQSDVI